MRRTITAEWIEAVREAIRKQGTSQNAVASEVGATSAAMNLLLGGKQQSSKLVEPISRVLGIDLPSLYTKAPEIEHLAEVCADLEPEDVEALLAMAKRMAGKK